MARGEPEPVRITSAARSHSDEVWSREKRYMLTMGIRTACFVAAVLCYLSSLPHWVAWVFVVGSLVLPYVAVVMANAGVSPDPGGPDPFDGDTGKLAIDRGPTPDEPERGAD
jgi:hypothetical protein